MKVMLNSPSLARMADTVIGIERVTPKRRFLTTRIKKGAGKGRLRYYEVCTNLVNVNLIKNRFGV